MRLIIQRVKNASVEIDSQPYSAIETGLLVLLGIEDGDNESDLDYCVQKLCSMRIFSDNEGKMNLDIRQVNGELLVVSQFTLHASTKKGNRPSFTKAAKPDKAVPLYELFVSRCNQQLQKICKTGVFGADMKVRLINDGPVTIILDSKNRE